MQLHQQCLPEVLKLRSQRGASQLLKPALLRAAGLEEASADVSLADHAQLLLRVARVRLRAREARVAVAVQAQAGGRAVPEAMQQDCLSVLAVSRQAPSYQTRLRSKRLVQPPSSRQSPCRLILRASRDPPRPCDPPGPWAFLGASWEACLVVSCAMSVVSCAMSVV